MTDGDDSEDRETAAILNHLLKDAAQKNVPPESAVIARRRLNAALATLTDVEQEVLILRFGLADGFARTIEEVGKKFTVTNKTIKDVETRALRKMRHPDALKKILDESNDINRMLSEPIEVIDLVEAEKKLTPYLISHLKNTVKDLEKLNPAVFEHLVGEFFASWGFDEVRLVGTDSTTSADVFAMTKLRPDDTEIRYFVEVKRWKEKVGISVINGVIGAISGERDKYGWSIGMIVTSSCIVKTKRYSNLDYKGIHLKDKNNVIQWLEQYKPNKNGLWLPNPLRKMKGNYSNMRLQRDAAKAPRP